MERLVFTSKQIENDFGLKANTLHYYIREGAIIPDIDEGSGTGSRRLFSAINYFETAILRALMNYGLPKKSNVAMLKSIREAGDRELLSPEKFILGEFTYTTEFLFFIPQGGGFTHRFLSDGGTEYTRSSEEWKKFEDITSYDGIESAIDYLNIQTHCIVINLSQFWGGISELLKTRYQIKLEV